MKNGFIILIWALFATTAHAYYSQYAFRSRVEKAIADAHKVLDTTRNLQLAEDVPHLYQDKFALIEFMVNTAMASYLVALEKLGLSEDHHLPKLLDWHNKDKSVTLRFQAEISSDFVEEKKEKVEKYDTEVERPGILYGEYSERTKVSEWVTEYHWKVNVAYKIIGYAGTDIDGSLELLQREASTTIITTAKKSPIYGKVLNLDPADLNISWLLDNIAGREEDDGPRFKFAVDRLDKGCKTPRRNKEIDAALNFARDFRFWAESVQRFFVDTVDQTLDKHKPAEGVTAGDRPQLRNIKFNKSCFIIPVMDNGTILVNTDVEELLKEQERAIEEKKVTLTSSYPKREDGKSLVSVDEAMIVLLCDHISALIDLWHDGVDYIEDMLRNQLIQAIGKHVSAHDFEEFMKFHGKRFFDSKYSPEPFARAIRQPEHFPDGILSLETTDGENVNTLVRAIPGNSSHSIQVPINAATSVDMSGNLYLHGWMQHSWSGSSPSEYQLTARARQLSSFLLIIGSMAGPNEFSPKHAIILRNKDEVLIPLLTEVLPSAKAFRDAVISLSPEQQAFAKAFRNMQLKSSVFGVCVVQLKPQLEKLLNLPPGALMKEIQLTEDLMSLFVDYQIPSDLLSYDDEQDADSHAKVQAVKGHVSAVMKVIDETKKKQLSEAEMKADMRKQEYRMAAKQYPPDHSSPSATPSAVPSASPSVIYFSAPSGGPSAMPSVSSGTQSIRHAKKSFHAEKVETSQERGHEDKKKGTGEASAAPKTEETGKAEDFTKIPVLLDAKLEKYDEDGSLRSGTIKTDSYWLLKRQASLLSPLSANSMYKNDIDAENKKALDLLDAISRSGTLPVDSSELHIIITVSHCFEKSLMETVIEDNINPIEKVEKSLVLFATALHGDIPASQLFGSNVETLGRMTSSFPKLFSDDGHDGSAKTNDAATKTK